MARRLKAQPDPGLQQIEAFERLIREGHPEVVRQGGASEAEVDRARTKATRLAATIGERLRSVYLSRGGEAGS